MFVCFCLFFFSTILVNFTNCDLLGLVPSNTKNSFIMSASQSICFFFLLQVDRTLSHIDSPGYCIFFPLHQPILLFLILWVFECAFSPSPMCFLYYKIFRWWPVSIFVYLSHRFFDAGPGTEVKISNKSAKLRQEKAKISLKENAIIHFCILKLADGGRLF